MRQLIFILCAAFVASIRAGGQGYVIDGEVTGAEGQTVSLKQFRDMKPVDIGSATVKSGRFTLKGKLACPEFCLLYVGDNGQRPLQFFVENSNIRIVADAERLNQAKVTGSKENDIFTEFVNEFEKYNQQQQRLDGSYATTVNQSDAASIRTQTERLEADWTAFMIAFVQKYPGKVSTAFIVTNFMLRTLDMRQLEQAASGFGATAEQSQWVKILKDNISSLKRTAIGQPFPDLTLKTPDDRPISISDYAGKGKYVLLDFWASWCGPCRNANPGVVELYRRYRDKGFEIVGISLDRGKKEWIEAIKSDNLAWPHMSDLNYWQSAAAKLYSVSSIPYTVLLNREGKIIAKGLHASELKAKLAELMD
jgi:thiol-disulfide isomerase/thioredoxin